MEYKRESLGDLLSALYKQDFLENALENLPDRERLLVESRYGLKDGKTCTLEGLGEKISVSPERAKQLKNRAIRKIERAYFLSVCLDELLEDPEIQDKAILFEIGVVKFFYGDSDISNALVTGFKSAIRARQSGPAKKEFNSQGIGNLLLKIYGESNLTQSKIRGEAKLTQAIAELPDKEKNLILIKYGLIEGKQCTDDEVKDALGIEEEEINELETKTIKEIAKRLTRLNSSDNFNSYQRLVFNLFIGDYGLKVVKPILGNGEAYKQIMRGLRDVFQEYSGYTTPLEDLAMPYSLRAVLRRGMIKTLKELSEKTEEELLRIKNLGEKRVKEAKELLAKFDLELKQPKHLFKVPLVSTSINNILVDDCEFSVRARKTLEKIEIKTLGQLSTLTEKDLYKLRNCGATTIREIRKQLRKVGLDLRNE